jgi:zinc protease
VKVFVESSHDLPLLSVLIGFRSGATHDLPGKEGTARMMARMLRRGAAGWASAQIEDRIDSLGGEFGADTSASATSVHAEVIRRSLDPFAELCATLIAKPTFDTGELERLKREAEAELIEARDSDRALCSRAFRRTLFEGHLYGRRAAGTIESIRTIERADVEAFYRRHITRANAVVAISGDVDEAEGRALADRLLAGLPEGKPIADPATPPKARPGRHLVFVDKAERTQTQMVIGGLGTDPRDPDHFPLMVANTAFGGTFTSRLMSEVRSKRGWSYGAYSRVSFDRQRDAFTMWTAPKATDAAACLALQLELLHTWREGGINEGELQQVKSYLVRSHAFEVDTARKRAHQKLESALFDLPAGYHERYLEQVEAVTLEQANAAVRARIPEADLTITVVGTHAELGEPIAKAIPDLKAVTLLPYDFE